MNWEDGRLFLAVARAGQMLGAAGKLGINQATLSRRISALEKDLGVKLMIRRSRGCELTPAGQKLKLSLEKVESELMRATSHISEGEARLTGEVRIGTPDGFGVAFLAPRLAPLADEHPGLGLQLVPVTRSFSLSEREADIAILIERPQRGALVARKLTDYSLGLYASPGYLARHGQPRSIDDLAEHRLIGYVEDLLTAPALAYAQEIWPRWRAGLEISSALGQMEAVRAGGGIAVLHDYLARGDEGFVPVLPAHKAERSYWLAYHQSLRGVSRIETVADFIAGAVRAERARFKIY